MNFHAIILWVKKYVFPCKENKNEIGNVCEASKVNLNSPDYDWQCVDKGGIMISSKTIWAENISVKKIFLIHILEHFEHISKLRVREWKLRNNLTSSITEFNYQINENFNQTA
jgi:hypothetical protein